MFAPCPPDVLSVALLPVARFAKDKNLVQINIKLPQDKFVSVVLLIPSKAFADQEAEAETKVIVVIPASILPQAEKAEQVVRVNLKFSSGVLLVSQEINELDPIFNAPVPIDDLTNEVDAIIVVAQNFAPLEKQALTSSIQCQAISSLLSSLTAPQHQFSKESAASARLTEDQQGKSTCIPLFNGSEDSRTIPVELLHFVKSVVSTPSPRAKDSAFCSNTETVLRYFNREEGSRNEYPYEPEWGIVNSEPVVALIDAHVLFAQECLSKIHDQAQVSEVRLPSATPTSSLTSSRHSLRPSTEPTILPSLQEENAGLQQPAVRLLRPVRSILLFQKKIWFLLILELRAVKHGTRQGRGIQRLANGCSICPW